MKTVAERHRLFLEAQRQRAEKMVDEIRDLPPHVQLHLAAELLVEKRPGLALAVAKRVVEELELLRLQGKL